MIRQNRAIALALVISLLSIAGAHAAQPAASAAFPQAQGASQVDSATTATPADGLPPLGAAGFGWG